MSRKVIKNMAHSVNMRLKDLAIKQNYDFSHLILNYAIERFLYRLGASRYAENFILKGACAFTVWCGPLYRATQDADLYCHGNSDPDYLANCFKEICTLEVPDDGVDFDLASFKTAEIRKDAKYHGTRIIFIAQVASARAILQFDIGFGDSVFPAAENYDFPCLLNTFPTPNIRVYPRCTAIAEKLEAVVSLGMTNSRLKDYFDLWLLTEQFDFDAGILAEAIRRTFAHRGTVIPVNIPIGLSDDFANDRIKNSMWTAFIKKISPPQKPENFREAINRICKIMVPVIAGEINKYKIWKAGTGWQ